MKIFPAIDLFEGKAVRLVRGKLSKMKIYGDPLEIAERFSKYFKRLHIVDLEGAFEGKPGNFEVVRKITEKFSFEIEIGGGFRKEEDIERAFDCGVKYVILGTAATNFRFLEKISGKHNGITVSLDSKNGKVKTSGWIKESMNFTEFFDEARKYVKRFVYTDITRDGTLSGVERIRKFWDREEIVYAGGVATKEDIKILNRAGFSGVIVGKALYERKLTEKELAEVEKCLQKE